MPFRAAVKEGFGILGLHAAVTAGFVRAAAMCAEATSTRLGLADTTAGAGLQRGALESTRFCKYLPWAREHSSLSLILSFLDQFSVGVSSPVRVDPSTGPLMLII